MVVLQSPVVLCVLLNVPVLDVATAVMGREGTQLFTQCGACISQSGGKGVPSPPQKVLSYRLRYKINLAGALVGIQ